MPVRLSLSLFLHQGADDFLPNFWPLRACRCHLRRPASNRSERLLRIHIHIPGSPTMPSLPSLPDLHHDVPFEFSTTSASTSAAAASTLSNHRHVQWLPTSLSQGASTYFPRFPRAETPPTGTSQPAYLDFIARSGSQVTTPPISMNTMADLQRLAQAQGSKHQHRVYWLHCSHCSTFLTDRGMRVSFADGALWRFPILTLDAQAVLLLRPNITLYRCIFFIQLTTTMSDGPWPAPTPIR